MMNTPLHLYRFHRSSRRWFAALAVAAVNLENTWANPIVQEAYLKASNTQAGLGFGYWSVAASGDTVVVGTPNESSNATGVNGNQTNNLASYSGAAYIFFRSGTNWSQQAYLKASNTENGDFFGWSVAISGDTVVVGAPDESSNSTGINGNQANNNLTGSGAAYVFVRSGTYWSQQAYLKASNTGRADRFGRSVSVSGDSIVVGAGGEASNATGIDGNQNDNSAAQAGAAYVFVRSGTNWSQQAYLKASNAQANDAFGDQVAISGHTLVVTAQNEDSSSPGVNGDQYDNNASFAGAAYVFVRSGTVWTQQAYLKASNPGVDDRFGYRLSLSGDVAIISADGEASAATGVNGVETDNTAPYSGAAYVFVRAGTNWSQQAYLKASNTESGDFFGDSVGVSGDIAVVGASTEDSTAAGVNGDQSYNLASSSGAAYVFVRAGTNWYQQAYLKASNTGAADIFGRAVAVSGDTVLVGAPLEDSNATGVNGNQSNNSATNSGAVYVFTGFCATCPQLALVPDFGSGYFLRFYGTTGLAYRLERAPTVAGPWETINTQVAPASGFIEYHETAPPPEAAFYRAASP